MDFFKRIFGFTAVAPETSFPSKDTLKSVPAKTHDADVLLQKLIDSTDIFDCIRAYTSAMGGTVIEQRALDKIKKLARSFEDWKSIFNSVSPASSLGSYALAQLLTTARAFTDWQYVYSICSSDDTRLVALEKIAAVAHTREEQIQVYEMSPENSSIKALMLSTLKSQAKSLEEWKDILDSSNGDLERFAMAMVVELTANKIDDLIYLLSHNSIDDKTEEKILSRIRGLKMSIEDWTRVAEDEDTPVNVMTISLDKITNDPEVKPKGFEDWKKVLDIAREGSELEKTAASMVIAFVPLDDLDVVEGLLDYPVVENNSDLEEKVLEKLRVVSSAFFDGWKGLYENTENEEVKEIALDKMIEGIDSIERLFIVDEDMVDEDDQDEEYDKKLGPKAKSLLTTEEDCLRVTEKYYAGGIVFSSAVERLLVIRDTTERCLDLFLSLLNEWKDTDGDCNDDLLEKAEDRLLSVATTSEIYILSKLGGEFGEIASKARNKIGLNK